MSENLYFFEEYSSNMPQESIDILAQPSWKEFCDAAKDAEAAVAIYDPTDNDDRKKVNQHAINLSEKFGFEHNGMSTKVMGLGYNSYYKEGSSDVPTFLDTHNATFHGVDLCFLDGRWQAMLEFYCHDSTDEMPHGIYHVPPDVHHLMILNIDVADEHDDSDDDDTTVMQRLSEDFNSVHAFMSGQDFAAGTHDEQRKILDDNTSAMNGEMPQEFRDRDVVIACTRYYTAYDDMHYSSYANPTPGFDLRDFLTDLSSTPSEERTALVGVIVDFEYPELAMLPPDQPLNTDQLNMNDGSYCLVLRSDKERATHYILPQTIEDIF